MQQIPRSQAAAISAIYSTIFALGLITSKVAAQSQLRSVEWPGIGKTTAVCVKKDGWYVCVLPEGIKDKDIKPRIFDEEGKEQSAKLLHRDEENGLCLFESDGENQQISLSTRSLIEPGLSLISLLPQARLKTRVAGKDREYLGQELPAPMIRVRVKSDEICQPGTPLLNDQGELEGLISNRKLDKPNEAHAIPAGLIRKVITDLETHQKSGPVWVGMLFQSNSSVPKVVKVKDESPAQQGGIMENDIILAVGDRRIHELDDLIEELKLMPAGKKARFKVLRDLEELDLVIIPQFAQERLADAG